jgi:predicted RND superfamily exporter protein
MPKEASVFNPVTLAAIEALTDRYGEVQSAISVASLVNYRLDAVDADKYHRDFLVPDLADLSEDDYREIRDIALDDESLTRSLLAPSGDMALAVVKFRANSEKQAERLDIARSVEALRDSLREQFPQEGIYTLGRVQYELDSYRAQVEDRQFVGPLVILVSTVLLWYCLRSLPFALCMLAISAVTILLTVGTIGWLRIPFNQISNMGPLVVLIIAMADGIHLVSIYLQGMFDGRGREEAMRESLRVNLQPVTLATITTAMGFLSLNYCDSPGIYGFGNVVAIGVVWAFLVTFMLLPALVMLLPVRKVSRPLAVRGFIAGVTAMVHRHGRLLLWSGTVLIIATLAMLPLNKIDFERFSFVDEDSDFHKVMTALKEKIGNDQSLVFVIDSGEYYGVTEPGFLNTVEDFTLWLEQQPEASFVRSYTGLLKTLNEAEHDGDEAWRVLPDDKLQVIDYLVSYQLIQEIEPQMEPLFDADYASIRMIIGTSSLTNGQLLAFNERIEGWIEQNLDGNYRVLHGDHSILFARLDRSITVQLLQGFTLSFILITLTMLIGLRSVRYGLLSIAPNLFPATIVFGFWGLIMGGLNPYILMLFSISIGLVVDDSVHVLSKYIVARREGQTPESAVTYSLSRAGPAITITTLSLAVGTFLLVFSNTFYYQNVAYLLTPIIVVALLLDLLFLPPLLIRFDTWLDSRRQASVGSTGL